MFDATPVLEDTERYVRAATSAVALRRIIYVNAVEPNQVFVRSKHKIPLSDDPGHAGNAAIFPAGIV